MSTEEFDLKFKYMIDRISYSKYIFDACKMCGYGEFVVVDKDDTLSNLYKAVARQHEMLEIKDLYLRNEETKEMKRIPNTDMILRYYISKCYQSLEYRHFLQAVYEPPNKVVYRVFFDDGHGHGHQH